MNNKTFVQFYLPFLSDLFQWSVSLKQLSADAIHLCCFPNAWNRLLRPKWRLWQKNCVADSLQSLNCSLKGLGLFFLAQVLSGFFYYRRNLGQSNSILWDLKNLLWVFVNKAMFKISCLQRNQFHTCARWQKNKQLTLIIKMVWAESITIRQENPK